MSSATPSPTSSESFAIRPRRRILQTKRKRRCATCGRCPSAIHFAMTRSCACRATTEPPSANTFSSSESPRARIKSESCTSSTKRRTISCPCKWNPPRRNSSNRITIAPSAPTACLTQMARPTQTGRGRLVPASPPTG